MKPDDTIKVQNLILKWLSAQHSPVSDAKIRDVCKAAAVTILDQELPPYLLHTFFYPLVRAGYVECGISSQQKIVWQFSPPMVFVRDSSDRRQWVGINLLQWQKDTIPDCFPLHEDQDSDNMQLHSCVVYWETPPDWDGDRLPIVNNPPVADIMRCIPQCAPTYWGQKANVNISHFQQIFCPGAGWRKLSGNHFANGLYRQSDQVFSSRIYYREDETFSLSHAPDSSSWAQIMSFIDNHKAIGIYNEANRSVAFKVDLPIMIARLLFVNAIFTQISVNTKTYMNIDRKIFGELQRIFCGSITQGANHD